MMVVIDFDDGPGAQRDPPHSHPHEQGGICLQGAMEFTIGETTRIVRVGESWLIPGGATHVDSSWTGDELDLKVQALGQSVDTRIGVEETRVRVQVMLPGMLAMFA